MLKYDHGTIVSITREVHATREKGRTCLAFDAFVEYNEKAGVWRISQGRS